MATLAGLVFGFLAWFVLRYVLLGFYTVDQNERAVKSSFGRAHRVPGLTTLDSPLGALLREDERERYAFPQLRVMPSSSAAALPRCPFFTTAWSFQRSSNSPAHAGRRNQCVSLRYLIRCG